jgi:hypothetical protein
MEVAEMDRDQWEKEHDIDRRMKAAASASYKIVYDTMDEYNKQMKQEYMDDVDIGIILAATLERMAGYVRGNALHAAMFKDGVAYER